MTARCFFATLERASVLGPGMVSASLKKRWSSDWQKYWEPKSSWVQMICAPCLAACSARRTWLARFLRKSSEQAICVRATLTTVDEPLAGARRDCDAAPVVRVSAAAVAPAAVRRVERSAGRRGLVLLWLRFV